MYIVLEVARRTAFLAISCLLKRKPRAIHLTLRTANLWRRAFLSFAPLDRLSYRVSSWIDGSSVQTRPAGDHFTAISLEEQRTFSQFPQSSRERSRRICMRSHAASNWRRGLGNPPPFVPTNVWMQGAWSTPLSCRCNELRTGIPILNLDLNLHLRHAISARFYASWWNVRIKWSCYLHSAVTEERDYETCAGPRENLTGRLNFRKSQYITSMSDWDCFKSELRLSPNLTKCNFRKAFHS